MAVTLENNKSKKANLNKLEDTENDSLEISRQWEKYKKEIVKTYCKKKAAVITISDTIQLSDED